jgi:hypothetical protein
MPKTAHALNALAPNVRREQRAETIPPQTHRLVTDVDPAFEQQIFDVPQRQRKPDVHHHHEADHLG